ncbi:MAG TPA: hypothetical protein VD948_09960 [Rhodothermales bacterium]|nr:hypothetical protein [Rhodothermales bacterium]
MTGGIPRLPGGLGARFAATLLLGAVLAGCSLFGSPEQEANVAVAEWAQQACSDTSRSFAPLHVHLDIENTGGKMIEFVEARFEVDVPVTNLSAQQKQDLISTRVCYRFEGDVCVLNLRDDWLLLLEPGEKTWRDLRYGGNSNLTRAARTAGGTVGMVQDVRLIRHLFQRDDPSG